MTHSMALEGLSMKTYELTFTVITTPDYYRDLVREQTERPTGSKEHIYNFTPERKAIRRYEILKRDSDTCQMCKKKEKESYIEKRFPPWYVVSELEVHHIIPEKQGGTYHPQNLITLCRDCHGKAGSVKLRDQMISEGFYKDGKDIEPTYPRYIPVKEVIDNLEKVNRELRAENYRLESELSTKIRLLEEANRYIDAFKEREEGKPKDMSRPDFESSGTDDDVVILESMTGFSEVTPETLMQLRKAIDNIDSDFSYLHNTTERASRELENGDLTRSLERVEDVYKELQKTKVAIEGVRLDTERILIGMRQME